MTYRIECVIIRSYAYLHEHNNPNSSGEVTKGFVLSATQENDGFSFELLFGRAPSHDDLLIHAPFDYSMHNRPNIPLVGVSADDQVEAFDFEVNFEHDSIDGFTKISMFDETDSVENVDEAYVHKFVGGLWHAISKIKAFENGEILRLRFMSGYDLSNHYIRIFECGSKGELVVIGLGD